MFPAFMSIENNIEGINSRRAEGASVREVVESALTAAESLNETLNAFLQIDRAGALKRAAELEAYVLECKNGFAANSIKTDRASPAAQATR